MASSGLLPSFISAIQASLSVLLVISYGALAAKYSLLSPSNSKAISKICVKMFLPLLLLVQIGSELHPGSAHRYLIILAWAFICHLVSFAIGMFAHLVFGMPDWITAAIMFNNTTSYPLLLIQSLDQTGILKNLIIEDEGTKQAIERAKSYFLVFATVSSCLTFAVGPRLIDSEHAPEAEDYKSVISSEGEDQDISHDDHYQDDIDEDEDVESAGAESSTSPTTPTDRTRLLPRRQNQRQRARHYSTISLTFFPSAPKFTTLPGRRPFYIPHPHWADLSPRTKWWLLFFYDFLNAPLLGAVLGAIIGLTPPLHKAFFASMEQGGVFTAWLTESWRNVGGLFVPLPLIVAGISLYTSYTESKTGTTDEGDGGTRQNGAGTGNGTEEQGRGGNGASASTIPLKTTLFILLIRFVFWPVLSISSIYFLVVGTKTSSASPSTSPLSTANPKFSTLLSSDPTLWFALMLMPTGPPAMKLITMVQVSDAGVEDERRIARILTVSYVVSPVLAFAVVGALRAAGAAIVA